MPCGCSMLKTVGSMMSGTFGPPMTRRLIEYSAIIIRILASRSMMRSLTFSQPVIMPATAPAPTATSVAANGLTPTLISVAAVAPPSGKLPSTVRSGKRRMRKEISTPKATSPYIRPISSAPHNAYQDMRVSGLFDDVSGRIAQLFRQRYALLAGRNRIKVQGKFVACFGGDFARVFSLEDSYDNSPCLTAHFIVIEPERSDGPTLDTGSVRGNQRNACVVADFGQRFVCRDHIVVGAGVNDINLAHQADRKSTRL